MKTKRIVHNIILVASLTALGAGLWYAMRRMTPAVAGPKGHRYHAGRPVHHPPSPPPGSPLRMNKSMAVRPPEAVRERRARLDDVITRHQALSAAQQAALAAHPELELSEVLTEFADSNRQAIAGAESAQQRFLKPAGSLRPPARLPGAEADQARFTAVRQAVVEEGMSLEQAESRYLRAASDP